MGNEQTIGKGEPSKIATPSLGVPDVNYLLPGDKVLAGMQAWLLEELEGSSHRKPIPRSKLLFALYGSDDPANADELRNHIHAFNKIVRPGGGNIRNAVPPQEYLVGGESAYYLESPIKWLDGGLKKRAVIVDGNNNVLTIGEWTDVHFPSIEPQAETVTNESQDISRNRSERNGGERGRHVEQDKEGTFTHNDVRMAAALLFQIQNAQMLRERGIALPSEKMCQDLNRLKQNNDVHGETDLDIRRFIGIVNVLRAMQHKDYRKNYSQQMPAVQRMLDYFEQLRKFYPEVTNLILLDAEAKAKEARSAA